MILKPQKKAWLPLLIVGVPIGAFGAAVLVQGGLLTGVAAIGLAIMIVAYNGTIRLALTERQVRFKRFGLTVWSAPARGMTVESGRGGDLGAQSAWVFVLHSKQVGHVLRGWFADADIAALKAAMANHR
ncbi:hypothetical protein PQ455_18195 [Sphingomonas naphthae]|uniref:PH domain-containing protein n=1 Tax=Sphingomonas naphthae TaxID=1813468 RepID=A0ABY7TKE7_9SPHN|nr:hypothetical protein [Sphingomonas naphthae]WCT73513.1 hypothetical protein PQ455_18195 [Sphingomonas naphthae]